MKNKIVIFGTDKVFADTIAKGLVFTVAILSHFDIEIGSRLHTSEEIVSDVKYPFEAVISTKYYSARVTIDYCNKLPEEKFDETTDAIILAWNEAKVFISFHLLLLFILP